MGKIVDEKKRFNSSARTYRVSDEKNKSGDDNEAGPSAPPDYYSSSPPAASSSRWKPKALIRSLIPRKVSTSLDSLPPSYSSVSILPTTIVTRIAEQLLSTYSLSTLSSLAQTSKENYLAVQPILCRRVRLRNPTMDGVLSLDSLVKTEYGHMTLPHEWPNKLEVWKGDAIKRGTYFSKRNAPLRRLINLRYVETLLIDHMPDSRYLDQLRVLLDSIYPTKYPTGLDGPPTFHGFLPDLRHLSIGKEVVTALMTNQTPGGITHIHNYLKRIQLHLDQICLTYPTFSEPPTSTQLASEDRLCLPILIGSIPGLQAVTVHDACHQSLPYVKGGRNMYSMYTSWGSTAKEMIPPHYLRVKQLVEIFLKAYGEGNDGWTTWDIYDAGRINGVKSNDIWHKRRGKWVEDPWYLAPCSGSSTTSVDSESEEEFLTPRPSVVEKDTMKELNERIGEKRKGGAEGLLRRIRFHDTAQGEYCKSCGLTL